MNTLDDIVAALGGPEAASRNLAARRPHRARMSRGAIYMWRQRGRIPDSWHAALIEALAEAGIKVTPSDLVGIANQSEAA